MARGKDTSKHPNRLVGKTTIHDLDPQGFIGVNFTDGRDSVPLSELRHADEDSPMYGRKVSKTHLSNVSKKYNPSKFGSTNEVLVYRDL